VTEYLQKSVDDFVNWCESEQYFGQLSLAHQLFTSDVAEELYTRFFNIAKGCGLPEYLYLTESNSDELLFLGLQGATIDTDAVMEFLSTKQNPQKALSELIHTYKSKELYINWAFTREIYKEAENDIIAAIILSRLEKGLSIEELSEKSGVTIDLLTKIETRKQTPSLRVLNKIIIALDKKLRLV